MRAEGNVLGVRRRVKRAKSNRRHSTATEDARERAARENDAFLDADLARRAVSVVVLYK